MYERDCNFCQNFDFDIHQRCVIDKCTIFGPEAYKYYDEVSISEKDRRVHKLKQRLQEEIDKDKDRKIDFVWSFIDIVLIISVILSLGLVIIDFFIFDLSNPIMTTTMLIHRIFSKYKILFLYYILVFIILKIKA